MTPSAELRVGINAISAKRGGGLTYAVSQIEALSRLRPDWSITAYCGLALQSVLQPLARQNLELVRVDRLSGPPRFHWEQRALPRDLRERRVDVLYALGNYGVLRAPCPQAILVQSVSAFLPLSGESKVSKKLKRIPQRWLTSKTIRRANATVFVSASCRATVLERLKDAALARSYEVIHSGVDPAFLAHRDDSPTHPWGSIPYVAIVSDLYRHKNVETAIDALAAVKERSEQPLRLLIAGHEADRGYATTLRRRANEAGFEEHVGFVGHLNRDMLREFYRGAVVYLSTSLREAFPLTPLEAMACSTPVVLPSTPPFPEIFEDAAFYCEPTDSGAIAEGILRVVADMRLRTTLVARGLRLARSKTWEANAERLASVLEIAGRR